jgi:hypothetical protein
MKIEFTALTRPRIASGVSSCTSESRMTTLIMSAPPAASRAANESTKDRENANTSVPAPKTATATKSHRPTWCSIGRRAIATEIAGAPVAGAARNSPRPHGPTCRMSRATMGRSAVAPPSSTAKRSSEMAPSTALRRQMMLTPASTVANVAGSRGGIV